MIEVCSGLEQLCRESVDEAVRNKPLIFYSIAGDNVPPFAEETGAVNFDSGRLYFDKPVSVEGKDTLGQSKDIFSQERTPPQSTAKEG